MGSPIQLAPREVIKRSGERAPFDARKIEHALQRAGAATGEFDARRGRPAGRAGRARC